MLCCLKWECYFQYQKYISFCPACDNITPALIATSPSLPFSHQSFNDSVLKSEEILVLMNFSKLKYWLLWIFFGFFGLLWELSQWFIPKIGGISNSDLEKKKLKKIKAKLLAALNLSVPAVKYGASLSPNPLWGHVKWCVQSSFSAPFLWLVLCSILLVCVVFFWFALIEWNGKVLLKCVRKMKPSDTVLCFEKCCD